MAETKTITFSSGDTFNDTKIEVVNNQATLIADPTYPTDNPTIETALNLTVDQFFGFFETATKPSGTEVKYIIKDGATNKYIDTDSLTFVESNGTYTQSNTATEIDQNRQLIETLNSLSLVVFLHSDDGTATPIV